MNSHTPRQPEHDARPAAPNMGQARRYGDVDTRPGSSWPSWQPSLADRLTLAALDRPARWREAWAQRLAARWRLLARPAAVLLTLALFLLSSTLSNLAQTGTAWYTPVAHAAASSGGKNTVKPTRDLGSHVIPLTKGHVETAAQAKASAASAATNHHGTSPATMKPATVPLSATLKTDWLSSDQRLQVTVPAGAVTPTLLTQAGGMVSLKITELEGPSGGFGLGASGRISLGTYQFTLIGAHGALNATLAKPVALALYLNPSGAKSSWRGAGFDLTHVVFVETTPVISSATSNPATGALNTASPSATTRAYPAALDKKGGALRVSVQMSSTASGSGSTGTWNTDSPQAHWDATPDTGVDLSSGDLTYSYPLNVPTGPGGLAPKVTLSYDSSSVANEHNPQATAGWVGEGWDLSLGSISWGEHNVTGTCTILTCPNVCTASNYYQCTTFENSWSFSDPYGNGGELIPQDSNLSVWYDDTSNAAPTAGHIDFNLDSNPRVQIVAYTNPTANSDFPSQYYPVQPPCFRAFLPNGYMEEYGCTRDSLQFYVDANPLSGEYQGNYIYRWDLDMIVDPNGNQIHITYNQYKNWAKANPSVKFPIDAVPATITYDSPSCHSTTTRCTGSAWQPAVQIIFDSAITPDRLTGSACPTFTDTTTYYTSQTMRCDDVHDLSNGGSSSNDAAPVLQSLAILNDVKVEVTTTPSAPSWNILRTYNFSYDQGASATQSVPDPTTGQQESISGYLDLTQVQEIGDDGSTALPPLTMTYWSNTEYYVDSWGGSPLPSGNCGLTSGMSWNNAHCYLWAAFSGQYIHSMNNGRGWFGYFYWALAHNNTHGVNTGLTIEDPLTCNGTNYSTDPCSRTDDENWSKVVLTQRQESVRCVNAAGQGCGNAGTGNVLLTSTSTYTYGLTDYNPNAKFCSDCLVGMYWGDWNDGDKLDFYNAHFMGFHTTQVTNPDSSQQLYTFNSGAGYGVATSNISANNCLSFDHLCPVMPWTNPANALHGRVSEEDDYDISANGGARLKTTTTSYTLTCPPSGIGGSPHNSSNTNVYYVGQRTSELDPNNPVTVCEIETGQTVTSEYDGSATNHVDTTTAYTYAYSGFYMASQTQDTSASDNSQTPHIVQKTQLAWHDAITRTTTSASGVYFAQLPAIQTTEDGSNNVKSCAYTTYDGGSAGATGSQSAITKGQVTRTDRYRTSCTPGSLVGYVSSASSYDANGNIQATEDADALHGISGHTDAADCTFNAVAYSACATYDTLYNTAPTRVTNALGQSTTLSYISSPSPGTAAGPFASNGWSQWLTSITDVNGQTTYFRYDALGRLTATAQPPDTLSAPTTTNSYPISCPTNTSSEPCYSLTTTQQFSSGVTDTSATYYDGWGRAVETVKPAFSSGSTYTYSVQYTMYDGSGRKSFVSDPYFVSTSSATPAYQRPDTTQPGTQYQYDGLGRVTQTTDAAGNITKTTYSVDQPTSGANITDTNLYAVTTVVDANSHKHRTLVDGLGHTRYLEQFLGNGGSVAYALFGTSRSDYDWLGNVTAVYEPADYPHLSAGLSTTPQTTTTYDLIGQPTQIVDADRGTVTQSYDPNGNMTESTDPRGSSGGITWIGYDGLNRPVWRNSATNSLTGAYVTYTYDQHDTAHGSGIGRLTSETFNNSNAPSGSPSMGGSYDYRYDARGRQTSVTQGTETNSSAYAVAMTYNDANQIATLQYSDNELLSYTYNSDGWLTDLVTTPSGGSSTNLLTNITYTGAGGAAGKPTGASVANGAYIFSATYDNDLRLQNDSLIQGTTTTLYALSLGYDGVSNVTSASTTLNISGAQKTDNQAFCYNEQNQLTWAGAYGSPSCGTSLTEGSLTSAAYAESFNYDALGRIWSTSVAGGYYTYGDSSHVHAVTSFGSSPNAYTAAYDAAGNMICRAPTSAATCGGAQTGWTGQSMSYDNEERLTDWASFQHQTGTPSTDSFLYDGSSQRVEQQSTPSGQPTATTRYVLNGLEEDSGGQLTKYLGVAGLPSAIRVGTSGTLSYIASDSLGSVSEALDGAGNVTAAQLYAPYGGVRYSSGTMPTAKGFTGQRADALTGLDYYGARYYDAVAGQFTSADTVADGRSPYAYVRGNPETLTDPSGHMYTRPHGGGGDPSSPPGTPGSGNGNGDGSGSGSGAGKCDTSHPQACGACNATCHIQNIAGDTANGFKNASDIAGHGVLWVGIAAAVSGLLTFILSLADEVPLAVPMGEFAASSTIIAAILSLISAEATEMHDMFAHEQSESQFSIASLEQLRSEASTTTLEYSGAFMTAYSALVAFATYVMPTLTFKSPVYEAIATAALDDAIGATAQAIIISESMNQYANDTIDQQEQYLQ